MSRISLVGTADFEVRALLDKFEKELPAAATAAINKAEKATKLTPAVDTAPAGKELDKFADEQSKGFGKKFLAGAGAAIAGFGLLISKEGEEARQSTLRLQRAIENNGETFDDYKGRIDKAIDTQAKYGVSAEQVRATLTTLTLKLKDPAKALDELQLITDVAAAKNISFEAATSLVTKALGGNAKVLAQFGIDVKGAKEAQKEATDATDAQAVAAAKLWTATQSLNDLTVIQGEKTRLTAADTIALRKAQEEVTLARDDLTTKTGVATEAEKEAAKAIKGTDEAIAQLRTKTQGFADDQANTLTGKIQGIQTAFENAREEMGQRFGPALAVAGTAFGTASGFAGQFTELTGKGLVPAVKDGVAKLRELGPSAIAAGAGIGVAVAAVTVFTQGMIEAKKRAADFVSAINEGVDTTSYDDLVKSFNKVNAEAVKTGKTYTAQTGTFGQVGRAIREVGELVTPLANKNADLRAKTEALTKANQEQRAAVENADKALRSFSTATGLNRDEVEKLAQKNKIDLTGSYGDITNALFKATEGTKEQNTVTAKLADNQEILADRTSTAAQRFDAYKSSLDIALGGTITGIEASIRHQEAIANLSEKLKENGKSLDLTTDKGRETAGAFNAIIKSAEGEVEALVTSGKITADSAEHKAELVRRLEDLRKKFPELKVPIQEYIDKVNGIPTEKATVVGLITGEAEAQALKFAEFLKKTIPASAFSTPNFDPNAAINQFFNPPGRAQGGPVRKGQPVVVGDGGRPELFVPDRDGTILPRVPQALGGIRIDMPITVNGDADRQTIADLQRQIEATLTQTLGRVLAGVNVGTGTTP